MSLRELVSRSPSRTDSFSYLFFWVRKVTKTDDVNWMEISTDLGLDCDEHPEFQRLKTQFNSNSDAANNAARDVHRLEKLRNQTTGNIPHFQVVLRLTTQIRRQEKAARPSRTNPASA